jgi:primosomal protein N' (replication factor Y)
MRYVEVHVPIPGSPLLTYTLPPSLETDVGVGSLVAVSVRSRRFAGCVARLNATPPADLDALRIRPVDAVLADGTPLPSDVTALIEWAAEYYMSSPGEVLRSAVPAGVGRRRRQTRKANETPTAAQLSWKPPVRLNEAQVAASETIARAALARAFRAFLLYGVTGSGKTEVYLEAARRTLRAGRGVLILAPEISLTAQLVARVRAALGEEVAVLHSALARGERATVWERLWRGECRLALGARSAVFAPVRDLGLVVVDEEHDGAYKQAESPRYQGRDTALVRARLAGAACVLGSATPSLESWSNAQRRRYELLRLPERVDGRPLATVRVIDMRPLADAARKNHRNEATPPSSSVIAQPFVARAASFHGAERTRGGRRMFGADTLFAALEMQADEPSRATDGRRTARNGTRAGTPAAGPVDAPPVATLLSPALREAIADRLVRGEQVLLYQNRRGYSTALQCWECGWVARCSDCDVSLTYHVSGSRLRCHYCGHKERAPETCPGCDGTRFRYGGVGIQKVEAALRSEFPTARLLRVDLDTVRRKGAHDHLLTTFAEGKADILLGTQMIAKGLDFPRVTLAGVIQADTQLHLPDFRSGERTFQLLTQVAGRSGRGGRPGEVILQTMSPGHPSLVAAAQQDFEGFARVELAERLELEYPPTSRLISLLISARAQQQAEEVATRLAHIVRDVVPQARGAAVLDPLALRRGATSHARGTAPAQAAVDSNTSPDTSARNVGAQGEEGDGIAVLGPAPRPMEKLLGRYRWHVLLKGRSAKKLSEVTRESLRRLDETRTPSSVRLTVDVDPVDLL